MPKSAKVFLVDDNEGYRDTVKIVLRGVTGHEVVAEAGSLVDALNEIPNLLKKGVNVAILDGNLTPGDISGDDGRTIASEIHKQAPEIKVIVNSTEPYDFGDRFVKKDIRELAEAVTAI